MPCERCESIHSYKLEGDYELYIFPPKGHCYSKLTRALKKAGISFREKNHIISLTFTKESATFIGEVFAQTYTSVELDDTKAVLLMAHEKKDFANVLPNTYSLKKVVGMCAAQWLTAVLEDNDLTTYCQPIVGSDNFKPFGFECLLRGFYQQKVISPEVLFHAARDSDMLFLLDRKSRVTHINNMSQINLGNRKIFINFNPTAIYDPQFCLSTTNKALKETNILPEQVIFEVTESDEVKDKRHLLNIIHYYRHQGYGVALDDLGSGYSSLNLLTDLQPDYIKLDGYLVSNIHESQVKQVLIENICEMAAKLHIKVICEGIECQEELDIIKQYKIDYYQGFLFHKPMLYTDVEQYLAGCN